MAGELSTPEVWGIDVSQFQGDIDWVKVKATGCAFAYIRTSDGSYHDPTFKTNWQGSKAAGLVRGVYHYLRSSQNGVAQADQLLKQIEEAGGTDENDLPIALDVEKADAKPEDIAAHIAMFAARVKEKTGKEPIIYTGAWFWDTNVKTSAFNYMPLWHSQYTKAPKATVPKAWAKQGWVIWQWSSKGTVNGIPGRYVDMNRFAGGPEAFDAFALGKQF